jgi:hypothetical protein
MSQSKRTMNKIRDFGHKTRPDYVVYLDRQNTWNHFSADFREEHVYTLVVDDDWVLPITEKAKDAWVALDEDTGPDWNFLMKQWDFEDRADPYDEDAPTEDWWPVSAPKKGKKLDVTQAVFAATPLAVPFPVDPTDKEPF